MDGVAGFGEGTLAAADSLHVLVELVLGKLLRGLGERGYCGGRCSGRPG